MTAALAFDPTRFLALVRERRLSLGQPLFYVPETKSTNDDALEAAKNGAPHGSLFIAENQTSGRGRRGRNWLAEPGSTLLFTLLLQPKVTPDKLSLLSLIVGLAVRHALSPYAPAPLQLKWPNDVVHRRQKLAGILIEATSSVGATGALASGGTHACAGTLLAAGIGINLATAEFPQEISAVATSLKLLGGNVPGRERLLIEILEQLAGRLLSLESGQLEPLLEELREHDALLGRDVTVEGVMGRASGINERGELLLTTTQGVKRINSGTVLFV